MHIHHIPLSCTSALRTSEHALQDKHWPSLHATLKHRAGQELRCGSHSKLKRRNSDVDLIQNWDAGTQMWISFKTETQDNPSRKSKTETHQRKLKRITQEQNWNASRKLKRITQEQNWNASRKLTRINANWYASRRSKTETQDNTSRKSRKPGFTNVHTLEAQEQPCRNAPKTMQEYTKIMIWYHPFIECSATITPLSWISSGPVPHIHVVVITQQLRLAVRTGFMRRRF